MNKHNHQGAVDRDRPINPSKKHDAKLTNARFAKAAAAPSASESFPAAVRAAAA
eukprot:CAMPEP_0184318968 /NCGR_PEP_ID=MMETSP1049-20130417/105843_1 /TAXON_ID=77928 /ORGANISM="Proteomonas sulcata, Strain CCMP704" /LENGTH=53 /DNA_ID=CAMNT_0026638953 /DNA_START=923 /DNA_END=1081 /DNA_ORIENTATION=+